MLPSDRNRSPIQTANPELSLWFVWIAIFSGMPIMMFFAGGGWPQGEEDLTTWGSPLTLALLAMAGTSFALRLLVLPKLRGLAAKLPFSIIGMALGEAAMILAMFVLPEEQVLAKQVTYVAAFVAVGSYVPIYTLERKGGPRDFTQGPRQ